MVGEPLASVLRSGRDLFNAKFVHARRRYPNLDGDQFRAVVEAVLDPLAQALPLRGEALAGWAQAAYDTALELCGERLIDGEGQRDYILQAWLEVVPRLTPPVLASSGAVLGSLSNAVHKLAHSKGARVEEWIRLMSELAARCGTITEFLQIGQVLAWRAGLAHYRKGALEIVGGFSEDLGRAALGLASEVPLPAALQKMSEDVWFDPALSSAGSPRGLRATRKVGAFRGFDGEFTRPPLVAASGDRLFVRSGEDAWLLDADVFGYALHRVTLPEFEIARKQSAPPPAGLQVTNQLVTLGQEQAAIDLPGAVTSVGTLTHTVAVTSSYTHSVQLLAR